MSATATIDVNDIIGFVGLRRAGCQVCRATIDP